MKKKICLNLFRQLDQHVQRATVRFETVFYSGCTPLPSPHFLDISPSVYWPISKPLRSCINPGLINALWGILFKRISVFHDSKFVQTSAPSASVEPDGLKLFTHSLCFLTHRIQTIYAEMANINGHWNGLIDGLSFRRFRISRTSSGHL